MQFVSAYIAALVVFGATDLVVVMANGKVLVCPKTLAPDLKRLVAALGAEGGATTPRAR